jgi:hypothetical protein
LEHLETRLAPTVNVVNVNSTADATNFDATTVTIAQVTAPGATVSLLDAINAANNDAVSNPGNTTTINLAKNATYSLKLWDNGWYGLNGLPPIASNITIHGNGSSIVRNENDQLPPFRLFYVSGGMELPVGSLSMDNVTLSGGLAKGGDSDQGGGGMGAGGAIFNQGSLVLTDVTLMNNMAEGGNSGYYSPNDEQVPVNGGGGMGENAIGLGWDVVPLDVGRGGGFRDFGLDGPSDTSFGGNGGNGGRASSNLSGGGGGGGGFLTGANGTNAANDTAGSGGGQGGVGGASGFLASANGQDGGDGGAGSSMSASGGNDGGSGGAFGEGGAGGGGSGVGGGGAGGGGGVGGGGGGVSANVNADGGGGGFGGGGGGGGNWGIGNSGGAGGFGGGGGAGSLHIGGPNGPLNGPGAFGGFGGGQAFHVAGYNPYGGGGAGMGGAIFNMGADSAHPGSGQVTLINCSLTLNRAQGGSAKGGGAGSGYGGALFNLDGRVTLTNDTLAYNGAFAGSNSFGTQADADGGAVYSLAYGNDIDTGAPVTATLVLNNSILAVSGIQSATVTGIGIGNDLVSQAIEGAGTNAVSITGTNNLVMHHNGSLAAGVITSTADPVLGPLQNNGGLTQTMLPAAGSPVLGAGNSSLSPATDQRGQQRPTSGPTDLGSVQVSTVPSQGGGGSNGGGGTGGNIRSPAPPNAGIVGLVMEEIELTIDLLISEIKALQGTSDASLDATIAQLQDAIQSDVSFSTPLGQSAVSLAQSLVFNALGHS